MADKTQNTESNSQTPTATPMMKQYLAIKDAHDDYLLFYRMGDFYELFFNDAVIAADVLNISLTRRGKHLEQDIPMCGVPYHSSEAYLYKLIKNGYKVAVCEQMESPKEAKKRGAKSVVRREVTRIMTPGTLTEEGLLDSRSSNFLAALTWDKKELALSWLDISTGEFFISSETKASIASKLAAIEPKEILVLDMLLDNDSGISHILDEFRNLLTPYVSSFFDSSKGVRKLKDFYGVETLASFGSYSDAELGSAGALIEYIELTQKGELPRLESPKRFHTHHHMVIDSATRKNLELNQTLHGEYKGSLFSTLDRTVTGAGARLLYRFLSAPLLDSKAVNNRLDVVQFFVEKANMREQLFDCLKGAPDMERALSRLYMGRGSPRDLAAIRDGLTQSRNISQLFSGIKKEYLPNSIISGIEDMGVHDMMIAELHDAIVDMPPFHARDGGFIRCEYDLKLDEYRNAKFESGRLKDELRDKYIKETGVNSLKIKDNNVLGFFVEVTPQHSDKIPINFSHRQTLASAVRYTTDELRALENKIINATGYALSREMDLFDQLVSKVLSCVGEISLAAQALSSFDVFAALAELAVTRGYVRPKVDNSNEFNLVGARHPVVEGNIDNFVTNDCNLADNQRLWLITGPNMAGKSTFLRQNALLAIMAQMGSYVPAESAHIGVVDRVFSRVGASDDLARGQSTFMVEMVETATILNNATHRSLVILDEIGRGTATFDGLSIAWAVVEYLHNKNKCRGLFATHYHELTTLSSKLAHLSLHTVQVKEWKNDIIFMHRVVSGVANRSYGIHVGRLAGLPKSVVDRADEVLHKLQESESGNAVAKLAEDLPLFALLESDKESNDEDSLTLTKVIGEDSNASGINLNGGGIREIARTIMEDEYGFLFELEAEISKVDIDDLTPRKALETLYELRGKLK